MRLFCLALLLMFAQANATRIVLFSDFNGSYGSTRYPAAVHSSVKRIVNEWKPDFVLSAGDLVAGQKRGLGRARLNQMWAAFNRDVQGPLQNAGIPFVFTLGNHDASLATDRRAAAAYWANHKPKVHFTEAQNYPFRYSCEVAGVFVAALDAAGPQVNLAQRQWLVRQLNSVAAKRAKIRLVVGHLPLSGVSKGKNKRGEVIAEALALRRVLEVGNATAYVSGHHAAYFSGKLGNLNVLAGGGIGGRDYIGHSGTARSVVTVLDIPKAQDRIKLTTYDADTGKVVPISALPKQVSGLGGTLVRVKEFWVK